MQGESSFKLESRGAHLPWKQKIGTLTRRRGSRGNRTSGVKESGFSRARERFITSIRLGKSGLDYFCKPEAWFRRKSLFIHFGNMNHYWFVHESIFSVKWKGHSGDKVYNIRTRDKVRRVEGKGSKCKGSSIQRVQFMEPYYICSRGEKQGEEELDSTIPLHL